jgi:hypothetical protein
MGFKVMLRLDFSGGGSPCFEIAARDDGRADGKPRTRRQVNTIKDDDDGQGHGDPYPGRVSSACCCLCHPDP